jgi:tape measure domain-containing protein
VSSNDIKLGVTLTADGKGLVGEVRLSKAELDKLKGSANKTGESLGNYEKKTQKASKGTSKFKKNVKSLAEELFSFKGVMSTVLAGLGIREFFQTADAFTSMHSSLRVLLGTQEQAISTQRELLDLANETYTGIGSTVQIYTRFGQATKELELSQFKLKAMVQAVNQSFRIMGSTQEEAASTSLQLAQSLGSGRLAGEEFKAVSESNIRLLQLFSSHLGVSTGALKQMASDGLLTTKVIVEALTGGLEQLNKEADLIAPTTNRAFGVLKNNLTQLVGEFDKAVNGSSSLVSVLEIASDIISYLANNMSALGAVTAFAATVLVTRLVTGFIAANTAAVILTGTVKGLGIAFKFMGGWPGIILGAVSALAVLIPDLVSADTKTKQFDKSTSDLKKTIEDTYKTIKNNAIKEHIKNIDQTKRITQGLIDTYKILEKAQQDAFSIGNLSGAKAIAAQMAKLTLMIQQQDQTVIKTTKSLNDYKQTLISDDIKKLAESYKQELELLQYKGTELIVQKEILKQTAELQKEKGKETVQLTTAEIALIRSSITALENKKSAIKAVLEAKKEAAKEDKEWAKLDAKYQKEAIDAQNQWIEDNKAISAHLTSLAEKYDPLLALTNEYKRNLEEIRQAYDAGELSGTAAVKAIKKEWQTLTRESKKLTQEATPFTLAWGNALRRIDDFGKDTWGKLLTGAGNLKDSLSDLFQNLFIELSYALLKSTFFKFLTGDGFSISGFIGGIGAAIGGLFSGDSSSTGGVLNNASTAYSAYSNGSAVIDVASGYASSGASVAAYGQSVYSAMQAGAGVEQAAMLAAQTAEFAEGAAITAEALGSVTVEATATSTAMSTMSSVYTGIKTAVAGFTNTIGLATANALLYANHYASLYATPVAIVAVAAMVLNAMFDTFTRPDDKILSLSTTTNNERSGTYSDSDIHGGIVGSKFGNIGINTAGDVFDSESKYNEYYDALKLRVNTMDDAIADYLGEEVSNKIIEGMKNISFEHYKVETTSTESFLLERYEQIATIAGGKFAEGYAFAYSKAVEENGKNTNLSDSNLNTASFGVGTTEAVVLATMLYADATDSLQDSYKAMNSTLDDSITIMSYFNNASIESQQGLADLLNVSQEWIDSIYETVSVYTPNVGHENITSYEGALGSAGKSNSTGYLDSEFYTEFNATIETVIKDFIELDSILSLLAIETKDFTLDNIILYDELKNWAGGVDGVIEKVGQLYSVNEMFSLIGAAGIELSIEGIRAADGLVAAAATINTEFTGMENLSGLINNFFNLFSTEAEKSAAVQQNYINSITQLNNKYNLNLSTSASAYEEVTRAILNDVNASDELKISLLSLAPAASNAANAMAQSAATLAKIQDDAIARMASYNKAGAAQATANIGLANISAGNKWLTEQGINWQIDTSSTASIQASLNTLNTALASGGTYGSANLSDAETAALVNSFIKDTQTLLNNYNNWTTQSNPSSSPGASTSGSYGSTGAANQPFIDPLIGEGQQLTDSMRSAFDVYNDSLMKYTTLLDGEYISLETYNQAVEKATADYNQVHYSAINALQNTFDSLIGSIDKAYSSIDSSILNIARNGSSWDEVAYQKGEISALYDELSTATGADAVDAINQLNTHINARYKAEIAHANALSSIAEYTANLSLSAMSLTSQQTLSATKNNYGQMLLKAQASDMDALKNIQSASNEYLAAQKLTATSSLEYNRMVANVQKELGLLSKNAGKTVEEIQTEAINELVNLQKLLNEQEEIATIELNESLDDIQAQIETDTNNLTESLSENNDKLIEALAKSNKELQDEIERLKALSVQQTKAAIKTARILEQWENDGQPNNRDAA